MSDQFYRSLQALADRAMRRFGLKGSYKAYLRRAGVDHEVTALEASFKPRERDGVIIQRTDTRYLISVEDLPFMPDPERDQLVIKRDAESAEEVWLMPYPPERIAPGGVTVFYQVVCRTG